MLVQQFQTENHRRENKNRAAGMAVTLALHAVLLLVLFFCIIATPDPPYQDNEGGMTVNYGTSDVGTGSVQPFTAVPVTVQQVAESNPASQPTTSSSPEDLETQNTEDAPVVEKKTEVKKKVEKPNPDALFKPNQKPAVKTPEPPKPQVDKNALFSSGAIGKPNKSKGDGEGAGQGDQGNPNGDPNSQNYHGAGTGNGPGRGGDGLGDGNVRLKGRRIMNRPPIKNPCESARGKVVISIKVNKQGRVTSTAFAQGGSTTADDCLVNTAKQAAMKYTFDASATADEVQNGSITFIFKED